MRPTGLSNAALGFHRAMTELAERLRRRPNKTGKHPIRFDPTQAILLRPLLWKKSFNASVSAVCIEESLSKAHRLSCLCASGLTYMATNTFPSRDFGRLPRTGSGSDT